MDTINRQRGNEELPCEYEVMVVDCYLSSSYEDPESLTRNGPSILSPRTHSEDIFRTHTPPRNLSAPIISYHHLYPPTTMKTHLPRLNELRQVLALAGENLHSGTRSNASHYTGSAPPDGRKANFQAVSGEGISTHENNASDRDAMSELDSVVTNELPEHPNNMADTSTKALTMLTCEYVPLCDVPNPAVIHPQAVLIRIFKSRKQSPKAGGTSKGSKSRKSLPAQESEQHL
ncbi:hypothetical protein CBS133816_9253 [Aspergillus niger]|nr:hypothetical protein CBS133816_9253 [Aspergillus niger]KAI2910029.1 hypothetical protein CBS147371_9175 [Aspergillus niger]